MNIQTYPPGVYRKLVSFVIFSTLGSLITISLDPWLLISGLFPAIILIFAFLGFMSLRYGLLTIPIILYYAGISFFVIKNFLWSLFFTAYPLFNDPLFLFFHVSILVLSFIALPVYLYVFLFNISAISKNKFQKSFFITLILYLIVISFFSYTYNETRKNVPESVRMLYPEIYYPKSSPR